jgi:hypothetical protein
VIIDERLQVCEYIDFKGVGAGAYHVCLVLLSELIDMNNR